MFDLEHFLPQHVDDLDGYRRLLFGGGEGVGAGYEVVFGFGVVAEGYVEDISEPASHDRSRLYRRRGRINHAKKTHSFGCAVR